MMVAWEQWKWRIFGRREEKIAREPERVKVERGRKEGRNEGGRKGDTEIVLEGRYSSIYG